MHSWKLNLTRCEWIPAGFAPQFPMGLQADVVCVVYAVDDEDSLDSVTEHWLPLLRLPPDSCWIR